MATFETEMRILEKAGQRLLSGRSEGSQWRVMARTVYGQSGRRWYRVLGVCAFEISAVPAGLKESSTGGCGIRSRRSNGLMRASAVWFGGEEARGGFARRRGGGRIPKHNEGNRRKGGWKGRRESRAQTGSVVKGKGASVEIPVVLVFRDCSSRR